MRFVFCAGN
uniref:Uncharacterized protein n=1 Tax=Arundo donax TaxID=35708 RepID=A0A0A9B4B2_ARUDO